MPSRVVQCVHTIMKFRFIVFISLFLACQGGASVYSAQSVRKNADSLDPLSAYGIFYDRYEPTFYTGFAPRVRDPKRLHLHVGRGNQLRATMVLSEEVLEYYAKDLLIRYNTYRDLIAQNKVVLTQNSGFETFKTAIESIQLESIVAKQSERSKNELKESNLKLLRELNPGRVFNISMSIDELITNWAAQLVAQDTSMDKNRALELVNQMLPTRLWLTKLSPENKKLLKNLTQLSIKTTGNIKTLREPFIDLLNRVSSGIYPVIDSHIQFHEFTAIYPVGTLNEMTRYQGREIPLYPTPGKWLLTTHQRTKTVDHIPTVPVYSYSPWIPYMHVGKKLHNSFHTLWWRMKPRDTSFLPPELKNSPIKNRDGDTYSHLWLLSRGPMSHGCTHVNAGHIMELRQLLPAETEKLYDVTFFINKSYLFDVFDIDGDFQPEVMGVRYFVAFSLRNKKPGKLRAPIQRRAYYDWLYGGELDYGDQGEGVFHQVRDGHFSGRKAVNGELYEKIALYEAEYQPERLQFYKMVGIPFARELRKVGEDHPMQSVN